MKPFQLLIKPVAADCNLECGYCFYRPVNDQFGGDKITHRMSFDTLEMLIKDYLSYRFDTSVICWQGGEPTLAGLDFFDKVVQLEMSHGRDGQIMGNAFQTNGLLIDDDWAKFLSRYKFLVGLSLDGPQDIHDSYRTSRSGRGSFERVMAAAERMTRHGVAFNILTVVSKANQHRAAEVYRFLRGQGFRELQFIPCLERNPSTGKPPKTRGLNPLSVTPEGYGQFLNDLFDVWRSDGPGSVSIRTFDCFLSVAAGRETDICIFKKRCGEYLLVEHNGDVYPCDFFVTPGRRLGNISDRPLKGFFELKRQREFARCKEKIDASCKRCQWLEQCHGGCMKDWMDKNGDDAQKSLLCGSYKKFFSHSMNEFGNIAGQLGLTAETARADSPPEKVGRNDPCPCGSGAKYKKCCGN